MLAKLYYELVFHILGLRGEAPIVVYQMGKVGSSSVYETLRSLNLNRRVYHIHSLHPQTLRDMRQLYYGDAPYCWLKKYRSRSSHLFQSEYLSRHLKLGFVKRPWKVVVLIRDPIARNVSSFFQTLDLRIPDFPNRYESGMVTTAELMQLYLEEWEGHDTPLIWLDKELKGVLGIDVYAEPFSKEDGYQTYHGELADVLLIKLEMLNRCAQVCFMEFLGINDFAIANANIASDKKYAKIYEDFLGELKLPDSYLDKMYKSRYVNHFYGGDEIQRFVAKWTK